MTNRKLDVLLLCPTGQDDALIAAELARYSVESESANSIDELCQKDLQNSGLILIAEEALNPDGIEKLNDLLSQQPPWSDIPIILLIGRSGKNTQLAFKRLEVFVSSGNVTLLERPLQPRTLISASQVALRSRRRQFQVQELLIQHAEATKVRDEFISIASHELKTPLTSLKLQTQVTRRQFSNPELFTLPKALKQLDYTINQIDRLNKLVDEMLDASRINTGKMKINLARINFSDLVAELVDRFGPQFEAVGCTVEADILPDIFGEMDAYKIEQVLNNLFSNAIRYSPGKPIQVGLRQDSQKIVLNVKDNGMGIEKHNLDRIFERFERATSQSSGLGLGLYITRQIVLLHGGTIKVESEPGNGANFIMELPL